MKKTFLILLLFYISINAQNYSDSLKAVEDSFKSFRYAEVIKRTPALILNTNFSPDTLINIFMMKGISHYVLQEDTLAKYSFLEILKLNPAFTPDSVSISPKIVNFFAEVREEFKSSYRKNTIVVYDTVYTPTFDSTSFISHSKHLRNVFARSLIFPGLGHIHLNDDMGWYLSVAGGLALLSSIYFIIDTENKRNDYLQERDLQQVSSKHDLYNTSYQIRNISILSFAALWLFSQIDLLTSSALDLPSESITFTPLVKGFSLGLSLHF